MHAYRYIENGCCPYPALVSESAGKQESVAPRGRGAVEAQEGEWFAPGHRQGPGPRPSSREEAAVCPGVLSSLLCSSWPSRGPGPRRRSRAGHRVRRQSQGSSASSQDTGPKSQDTEPEIRLPKDFPASKPTGTPVLEPAERFHLRCLVWGPRRVAERPYAVTAPTRLVPTYKTSEYKHPLLHPPPDPF